MKISKRLLYYLAFAIMCFLLVKRSVFIEPLPEPLKNDFYLHYGATLLLLLCSMLLFWGISRPKRVRPLWMILCPVCLSIPVTAAYWGISYGVSVYAAPLAEPVQWTLYALASMIRFLPYPIALYTGICLAFGEKPRFFRPDRAFWLVILCLVAAEALIAVAYQVCIPRVLPSAIAGDFGARQGFRYMGAVENWVQMPRVAGLLAVVRSADRVLFGKQAGR